MRYSLENKGFRILGSGRERVVVRDGGEPREANAVRLQRLSVLAIRVSLRTPERREHSRSTRRACVLHAEVL